MDSIVALVPMKGHSERVPRKNLKILRDKPLCYYVLKTLTSTDKISRVVVNTDCADIAEYVSKNFPSVSINEREQYLIGDHVSMNRIIEQDIETYPAKTYLQTHSTNPFLSRTTILSALEAYDKCLTDGNDSLVSVNEVLSRLYWENNIPINHNPLSLSRTQDLPKVFLENSVLYIFSRGSFVSNSMKRTGRHPFFYATPKIESIDIDDKEDFELAKICSERLSE